MAAGLALRTSDASHLSAEAPLLRVDGLTKRFLGLTAVNSLAFTARRGEVLGLIGPNGSGKTTTINLLTGALQPTSGSITFAGAAIAGLRPDQVVRRGISRTYQTTSVFGELSVADNLVISGGNRLQTSSLAGLLRLPRAIRDEERVRGELTPILELVGLARRADRPAATLSSAEQRKLMIANALATAPRLVLLDEPAAGMVAREREELTEIIRAIAAQGIAVLLVEHHMPVVMGTCQRIVVLNFGQKLAVGAPREIRDNPAVIQAYLGT